MVIPPTVFSEYGHSDDIRETLPLGVHSISGMAVSLATVVFRS